MTCDRCPLALLCLADKEDEDPNGRYRCIRCGRDVIGVANQLSERYRYWYLLHCPPIGERLGSADSTIVVCDLCREDATHIPREVLD